MTKEQSKLKHLLYNEGYEDELEFGEDVIYEGTCPGICMNDTCDFTCDYEPDQDKGWCEICGTQTVVSGLILMGIM